MAPDPEVWTHFSRDLTVALEAGEDERVRNLLDQWIATQRASGAEGDLYAALLASVDTAQADAAAEAVALAMAGRAGRHPEIWRAFEILFWRELVMENFEALPAAWQGLRRAPPERSAVAARQAGQALWEIRRPAPALRWWLRIAEVTTPPEGYGARLATIAWDCCRAEELAGTSLAPLLETRDALRRGDRRALQRAADTWQQSGFPIDGAWREVGRWIESLERPSRGHDPDAMAAVLPLSGRSASLGRRTLETLGACLSDGSALTVADSRSSALFGAAVGPDRDGPRRVFGPLRTEALPAASLRYFRLGRIAVTPNPNPLSALPITTTIWSVGMTPENQAREIAALLAEAGWRAVAVLAPESGYGQRFLHVLRQEVIDRGGWLTGIELYQPDATDFGDPVRRLVGLDRFDANEIRDLKAAGLEPEPILDFDALVLVGPSRQLALIPPQLAYYDVSGIRLVGDSGWDAPEVGRLAGEYARGAIFVSLAARGSEHSDETQQFLECASVVRPQPGPFEAMVYEGLRILESWRGVAEPELYWPPVPGIGGELRPGPGHLVDRRFPRWIWTRQGIEAWDGRDPLAREAVAP